MVLAADDERGEADGDHRRREHRQVAGHLGDHEHDGERGVGDAPEQGHHRDDHERRRDRPGSPARTGSSSRQMPAPSMPPMNIPGPKMPPEPPEPIESEVARIFANGRIEHHPERDGEERVPVEPRLDEAVAGAEDAGDDEADAADHEPRDRRLEPARR